MGEVREVTGEEGCTLEMPRPYGRANGGGIGIAGGRCGSPPRSLIKDSRTGKMFFSFAREVTIFECNISGSS